MTRRTVARQWRAEQATKAQHSAEAIINNPRAVRLHMPADRAATHVSMAICHANAADGGSGQLTYPTDYSQVTETNWEAEAGRWRP